MQLITWAYTIIYLIIHIFRLSNPILFFSQSEFLQNNVISNFLSIVRGWTTVELGTSLDKKRTMDSFCLLEKKKKVCCWSWLALYSWMTHSNALPGSAMRELDSCQCSFALLDLFSICQCQTFIWKRGNLAVCRFLLV